MPPSPDTFRECLVLTGPTGSGKTALAISLAERIDAEIIAADSMTLYHGMDIGTAKPTVEERERVRHHLIDVLDPSESASVAWWLEQAAGCVQEIQSRGKRVLVVGGTPFYLKAMLFGLFESPLADEQLRKRLEDEADAHGVEALHARLAKVDPVVANRLHPNDVRRVVRALEVYELTGEPLSKWQTQWPDPKALAGASGSKVIGLDLPREELYRRIDRRVTEMIEAGWLDEVRRLRSQKLSREAAHALGYDELGQVLDGKMSLADAIALIQQRSRQFAKRQLTWFRRWPGLKMIPPELTLLEEASRID